MKKYKIKTHQHEKLITAKSPADAMNQYCSQHFSGWYPPYHVDDNMWRVCNSITSIDIKCHEIH